MNTRKISLLGMIGFLVFVLGLIIFVSRFHRVHDQVIIVGTVPQDTSVKKKVTLRNTSFEPFTITSLETTCSCTSADYSKGVIWPYQTFLVEVTINSGQPMGPRNSAVTVNFDNRDEIELRYHFEAIEEYPRWIALPEMKYQEYSPYTFHVSSLDSPDFSVLSVTNSSNLVVDYEKETEGYDFRVLPSAEAQKGDFEGTIEIKTDEPTNNVKNIDVRGRISPDVDARPRGIALGLTSNDRPNSFTITLKSMYNEPFKIRSASSDKLDATFSKNDFDAFSLEKKIYGAVELPPASGRVLDYIDLSIQMKTGKLLELEIPISAFISGE